MFQLTFAIITPALVIGAYAERVKFSGMLLFSLLWLLLVYCPIAHWVWGDGWLQKMGIMDFAGGTVVHLNAGMAALVCALVLGRRKGFPESPMPPHNLPMTVTGAAMLWVGWFGFNAGSALAADGSAGMAMLVTHIGAVDRRLRLAAVRVADATASPRCSASSPAWWPAWAPSRPPPASSVRWARSRSAAPPAWPVSSPPAG
jgi:ammonia channel protein AmtB